MDIDPQVIYKARLLDAIDNELTDERLGICDMVILATWPKAAVEYVQTHADLLKPGAMVMDVCGVKQAVCQPLWALAQEKGVRLIDGAEFARMLVDVGIVNIDQAFDQPETGKPEH